MILGQSPDRILIIIPHLLFLLLLNKVHSVFQPPLSDSIDRNSEQLAQPHDIHQEEEPENDA